MEKDLKEKVNDRVYVKSEGKDRYQVFTPFMFADGDHFSIILKKEDRGWVFSDEGHTFMHLSFDPDRINVDGENRNITPKELSEFGVQEINGELTARIHNDRYGDTLQRFIQAIKAIIGGRKNEKRNPI